MRASGPLSYLGSRKKSAAAESGNPGGGQGRIDVAGVVPEDIQVDPDITEGHPGHEESGDSEIIPPPKG
jgi:hypothetical protein